MIDTALALTCHKALRFRSRAGNLDLWKWILIFKKKFHEFYSSIRILIYWIVLATESMLIKKYENIFFNGALNEAGTYLSRSTVIAELGINRWTVVEELAVGQLGKVGEPFAVWKWQIKFFNMKQFIEIFCVVYKNMLPYDGIIMTNNQ